MSESVWSRDSAIGIVTRLQAVHQRNHGSIPGRGKKFFSFQMHTVVPGAVSSEVKPSGCEADNSI